MPALTLHLVQFHDNTDVQGFLQQLHESPNVSLYIASKPRFHVIHSNVIDKSVLEQKWDLLLLLQMPPGTDIPSALRSSFKNEYRLVVGVPSKLLSTYWDRNAKLTNAAADVQLTGSLDRAREMTRSSSQALELSPDLLRLMDELTAEYGDKPVTMLNLLAFKPGMRDSYHSYGKAFPAVAGKRGGEAKIVGNVIRGREEDGTDWEEIALVHYPSIRAFCDMLAGEDYQEINQEFRLPALKDTLLLCTTETGLDSLRSRPRL